MRNETSTDTQLFRCLRKGNWMWKKRKEDVGDDEKQAINHKKTIISFADVNYFVNFAVVLIAIVVMAKREIRFYKHYFNEFFAA